jgi:hypothetical protein
MRAAVHKELVRGHVEAHHGVHEGYATWREPP